MNCLVEYQDEKVVLRSGSGSEIMVVGKERPDPDKWSGKEGHGVGQRILAGSGLRKWKRSKQQTGKRYILAAECAIRLMQENLSNS